MSRSRELRIFQKLLKRSKWMYRTCSSGSSKTQQITRRPWTEKDPLPIFLDNKVQILLKQMTGFDIGKVLSFHMTDKQKKPTFTLATDEQVEEMQLRAIFKAIKKLVMPPVMRIDSTTVEEILSRDPEIAEAITHNFVFTDVSPGVQDKDRMVTVRDTTGTLRQATFEEKRRACQMYNPMPGRKLFMPKMFEAANLEHILHENNYRYILDRACIQFEPNNPDFIRVYSRIFDHIVETRSFHSLRSTRYFGPMAFYLVWNNKIDELLIDMIDNHLLEDAISLLHLYQLIHPKARIIDNVEEKTKALESSYRYENEEVTFNHLGEVDKFAMQIKKLKRNLKSPYMTNKKIDIQNFDDEKVKHQFNMFLVYCKQYCSHKNVAELELTIQKLEEILYKEINKKKSTA